MHAKCLPFCLEARSCCSPKERVQVVYLLWAGYFRAGDSSFMGLQRQTGWRGGHRLLRELGHGTYLFWILLQLAFTWGVGVSRFNDNKHHPSDVRCLTCLLCTSSCCSLTGGSACLCCIAAGPQIWMRQDKREAYLAVWTLLLDEQPCGLCPRFSRRISHI